MDQLLGRSITYRIAVGPQRGRKVFTLQTLPRCDSDDLFADTVGKVAGVSLNAGVAIKVQERGKLERLCRYIAKPVLSQKCLSVTAQGLVS